ncbi:DUF6752 domain-containing protein [Nocardioides caldifontis]|uniref:DUF6752 domain-containing protein n=1 Tax=Nocardioides caldifontis TaxID=2588938 RepID=UPI0011E02EFA|nr:DUF6752 domain-containing protein [Nocardioides caldifontis]
MTDRVYLHVGAPKSGTTYLQRILDGNRQVLADAGVLVVGERHVDRVHAGMAVREDPRLENLPPRAVQAWKRLTAEIRAWQGSSAVLSYELFAGASAEQVTAALADLDGLEVHVVITTRDLARAVPSAWQERLKFALTTPLESWVPRPESDGPRAEWGWRTMDPAGVAARWGATLPPERVHVVTVPRDGAATELWHRFARACGIDGVLVDLHVPQVNESLGVVAAELLRRVNERLPEELGTNREQARWLRDVLAHRVLTLVDDEPIGITDDQFAAAVERSEEAAARIREAGYDVVGDLDDIRATRREARTPGDVTSDELVDVAVDAVVRLLLTVREEATTSVEGGGDAAAPLGRGWRARAKRLVKAAAVDRVDRELVEAQRRIAALEEQLAASRRVQLRIAVLEDLVAELLVPTGLRDEQELREAIRRYRQESL